MRSFIGRLLCRIGLHRKGEWQRIIRRKKRANGTFRHVAIVGDQRRCKRCDKHLESIPLPKDQHIVL